MKLKKLLGLAAVAGGGFAAYRIKGKMDELKATYDDVVTFTGEQKRYDTFDGASIAVMFAGCDIDLSDAEMVGNEATLKLYGEYAGISVKVPEAWNVSVQGKEDKSGVDKQVAYDGEDTESKVLIIDYHLKFSGLQVKDAKEAMGVYDVEIAEDDDVEAMPDPYEADLEMTEEVAVEDVAETKEEAVEEDPVAADEDTTMETDI